MEMCIYTNLIVKNLSFQVYGKNHPKYALSLNNNGSILFQLGMYKEAESILSQAIDILRGAGKTKHNLALSYKASGNVSKAKVLLEIAPGIAPLSLAIYKITIR